MSIIGRKITGIILEPESDYGFDDDWAMAVVVLDDGTKIFAMQDEEGNGPGVLMHRSHDGDEYLEVTDGL